MIRSIDHGNVDFPHRHHRIGRPFDGYAVGTDECLALLSTVAYDRVPVAIRFTLVFGRNLKRDRFVVLEGGSAIEPETRR